MCGGNLDLELKVSVFDYESDGKHVTMGELLVKISVNELIKAKSGELKLIKKGDVTGKIAVLYASVSGIDNLVEVSRGIVDELADAVVDAVVVKIIKPSVNAVVGAAVGGLPVKCRWEVED